MAFRMGRIVSVKSGAIKARKGIPKDVRDQCQALYGKLPLLCECFSGPLKRQTD
jgi:hypothetical protein